MARYLVGSLQRQFERDFDNVFCELSEFARAMRFEIMVDKRPHRFDANVVWDTDSLKRRMVVQQQGVYLGSVLLFIAIRYFATSPRADEILYVVTPRPGKTSVNVGWRILDVTEAEDVYEISLDRLDV
jgi:hypothetical protein